MKKICSALLWIECLAVMASGQVPRETNQNTGSILLFEQYSSQAAQSAARATQLRLANTHASEAVIVRVLFFEHTSLAEQAYTLRLAAGEAMVLRASEFDPGVRGWVMAVACDRRGLPQQFNWLAGSYRQSDEWKPAVAVAKLTPDGVPAINGNAPLKFGEAEAVMYESFPVRLMQLLPSQRWLLTLDDVPAITRLAVATRR
ncbi:MAG: hypothetical protein HOP19_09940 [Acidobacteria bacterium]|nr:hypothetical protein [Acidobacteriota bacterium]